MTIPINFISRIAIPAIVAALFLNNNVPEQTALFSKLQEESDRVLSLARGEGEGPTENYDYIIIGAGSAGAVLANRLTESGVNSVLLLDAGGDPNPVSDIPMGLTQLIDSSMWINYYSIPQTGACLNAKGECWFPRGKALGGSSSVNGLVYNRCNSKDYDSWANFTNDPIWRFESVVDAFKAVENYHGFYEDNPGPNHGSSGEINIGKIEFLPGVDTLFEALLEGGYLIGDLNSGMFPSGFSKIDYNIKDGLRHSTYHGFIEPILDRMNLHIYRYSTATKIHLDGSKKAVGVSYPDTARPDT